MTKLVTKLVIKLGNKLGNRLGNRLENNLLIGKFQFPLETDGIYKCHTFDNAEELDKYIRSL